MALNADEFQFQAAQFHELQRLIASYLKDAGLPASVLKASETHDFASVASGAQATIKTITVAGAAIGDPVMVTSSITPAGGELMGYVSAANTVSYTLQNTSGGAIDLASATYTVRVFKFS